MEENRSEGNKAAALDANQAVARIDLYSTVLQSLKMGTGQS